MIDKEILKDALYYAVNKINENDGDIYCVESIVSNGERDFKFVFCKIELYVLIYLQKFYPNITHPKNYLGLGDFVDKTNGIDIELKCTAQRNAQWNNGALSDEGEAKYKLHNFLFVKLSISNDYKFQIDYAYLTKPAQYEYWCERKNGQLWICLKDVLLINEQQII